MSADLRDFSSGFNIAKGARTGKQTKGAVKRKPTHIRQRISVMYVELA